jgi:hypothetical protein
MEEDIVLKEKSVGLYKEYTLPASSYLVKEVNDGVSAGRWAVLKEGDVWRESYPTANELRSGIYVALTDMQGEPYLHAREFKTDALVTLPDDPTTEVLEHIDDFWTRESKFIEFGFVFKRGILLYGPPGSGKSSTVFQLSNKIIEDDGIVLICDYPPDTIKCIQMIRKLEPNRVILVVMEDIDDMVAHYGDRSLTRLLDGGDNVNRVIFLATTNYAHRLPPRLLNRPSRFDIVKFIGMPTEEARRAYIKFVITNLLVNVEDMVNATVGFSIAQIKEVIILTQVFDIELSEAVDRVENIGKNLQE